MDKIEVKFGDYCVCIEEVDGVVTAKMIKGEEEEPIEEFSVDTNEDTEGAEDDIQDFDGFEGEEDDFDGEELPEGDDDFDEDDFDEDETKLESFSAFSARRK